jgi:cob(I)alamin adenosyltransferase
MGYVYVYYGTGGGKTTSTLGAAMRSVGHHMKVIIVQFLKWYGETGECLIADRLRPDYEIRQFGSPGWLAHDEFKGRLRKGEVTIETRAIDSSDREMAARGLEFARKAMAERPRLLVLDEVCLAVHMGILSAEDVLSLLDGAPEETDMMLTGRYAPAELLERADFVYEIVEKKAPEGYVAARGIQF